MSSHLQAGRTALQSLPLLIHDHAATPQPAQQPHLSHATATANALEPNSQPAEQRGCRCGQRDSAPPPVARITRPGRRAMAARLGESRCAARLANVPGNGQAPIGVDVSVPGRRERARARAQRVKYVPVSGTHLYAYGVPLTGEQFREAFAAMNADGEPASRLPSAATGRCRSSTPPSSASPCLPAGSRTLTRSATTRTTRGPGTRRTIHMPLPTSCGEPAGGLSHHPTSQPAGTSNRAMRSDAKPGRSSSRATAGRRLRRAAALATGLATVMSIAGYIAAARPGQPTTSWSAARGLTPVTC